MGCGCKKRRLLEQQALEDQQAQEVNKPPTQDPPPSPQVLNPSDLVDKLNKISQQ